MKSKHIINALNDIDPELVADAEGKHKKSAKGIILKWAAVAACLCVILAIVWESIMPVISPKIPVYDSAIYTAADIASLFEGTNYDGTSSYTKVYVPSTEYLYIQPVPSSEYLTIYQYRDPANNLSKSEFAIFLDTSIARFVDHTGEEMRPYEIKEQTELYGSNYLSALADPLDQYSFTATQRSAYNYIAFSSYPSDNSTGEIFLSGVRIEVDQTQSDMQIVDSLESIKGKLFSIFGVSFSDIRIIRNYDRYSQHGVTSLSVLFYNEADHPLNAVTDVPVSDCIQLRFDNFKNSSGDVVSDTVLYDVSVAYMQHRTDAEDIYAASKQVKMIPLADAEALLLSGYVFGGHSCPLCMAQQSHVDFSDYDHVGFTYLKGSDSSGKATEMIPFYTFYKAIGTADNGNTVYAQTYVPAFEVSGYEEYFESQKNDHKS